MSVVLRRTVPLCCFLLILLSLGCKRATTIPPEGQRVTLKGETQPEPPGSQVLAYEFESPDDLSAIRIMNVDGEILVEDGLLKLRTHQASPYVVVLFNRDASDANLFSVRLRGTPDRNARSRSKLYWTTPERPMGCEENAIPSAQGPSEFLETLDFPLCSSVTWKGPIQVFRFDLSKEPGTYEIDFIRVFKANTLELNQILNGTPDIQEASLGLETRSVDQCPASSQAILDVVPDSHSVLKFGFAVHPFHWSSLKSPVTASVKIRSWWRDDEVFSATVDPLSNEGDRTWQDGAVDLSKYAGRKIAINFNVSPETPSAWGMWSCARIVRSTTPSERSRPDIVLVSLDAMRADRMGVYGNPRPASPEMDAMARDGLWFDPVIAQSSWTLPSHMSLLTGLNPDQHQVQNWNDKMRPDTESVVASFREAGYVTLALTDGGFVSARWGLNKGFDSFREDDRTPKAPPVSMKKTVDAALALLEEHADEPVFLFIHTYEVHDYWKYREMSDEARSFFQTLWPGDPPFSGSHDELFKKMKNPKSQTPEQREWVSALYDARVFSVDKEMGRLRRALDQRGNTVLAITSDHGEELGERGVCGHGHSQHQELIKVPLILYAGQRVAPGVHRGMIRSLDILPMLAHLSGVSVPEGRAGSSLFLTQDIEAVALSRSCPGMDQGGYKSSLTEKGWNYLYDHALDKEELYDWTSDPEELQDRVGSAQEMLLLFRKELLRASLTEMGIHVLVVGSPQEAVLSVRSRSRLRDLHWTYLDSGSMEESPDMKEIRVPLSLSRGGSAFRFDLDEEDPSLEVTVTSGSVSVPITSMKRPESLASKYWLVEDAVPLPEEVEQAIQSMNQTVDQAGGSCQAFVIEVRGESRAGSRSTLGQDELDALKGLGYLK